MGKGVHSIEFSTQGNVWAEIKKEIKVGIVAMLCPKIYCPLKSGSTCRKVNSKHLAYKFSKATISQMLQNLDMHLRKAFDNVRVNKGFCACPIQSVGAWQSWLLRNIFKALERINRREYLLESMACASQAKKAHVCHAGFLLGYSTFLSEEDLPLNLVVQSLAASFSSKSTEPGVPKKPANAGFCQRSGQGNFYFILAVSTFTKKNSYFSYGIF